jgi:hypothetical protein
MTIEQISLGLSTGTFFVLVYLVWYLQRLQREIDWVKKQISPKPESEDGTLPLPFREEEDAPVGYVRFRDPPPGTRMTEIDERK